MSAASITWTVVTERRLAEHRDEYIDNTLSFLVADPMFGESLGPVDVIVKVKRESTEAQR